MSKLKYWLPTLAWMSLIFAFSSLPSAQASDISWQDFLLKKTAHFVEYFILSLLLFHSLSHTFKISLARLLVITAILAVFYAVSDEYHQSFSPGREPRLRDVAIDSLGISVACTILWRRINTPGQIV